MSDQTIILFVSYAAQILVMGMMLLFVAYGSHK